MTATELEKLVVRLTGDASSYLQMLKEAKEKTDEAATKIQTSIKNLATAAVGAMAGWGMKNFLQSSLATWNEQENAIIGMEAALRANGREVETLSKDYQAFSTEIQNASVIGDEVTQGLLKQAESFQLTGAAAKNATKDALALAAANGSSAEAMIRITAAMAEGDIHRAMMFSRMIPQLRGVTDELQFTERYQKLVTSGLETMTKTAETGSGRLKQLNNDWGDLKEQLGEVVSKGAAPVARGLSDIIKWMQSLSPNTKIATTAILALGTGLVTVATVGPRVVSSISAVTAATKAMALSLVTNPILGWTVAIGAATVAIMAFRNDIVMTKEEIDAMNASLEDAKFINERSEKAVRTNTSANLQDIERIQGIEERKKAYEKEKEDLKKHIKDLQAISQGIARPNMLERWFGGAESQKQEIGFQGIIADLKAYQDALLQVESAEQRLNRKAPAAPDLGPEVAQRMTDFENEAAIMRKRTEYERDYLKAVQAGHKENHAAMMARASAQLRELQTYDSLVKKSEDFIASLKFQRETLGMSSQRAELYRMEQDALLGVNHDLTIEARRQLELLEAAQQAEEKRVSTVMRLAAAYRDAAAAGSAEAATRIYDYQNMRRGGNLGMNEQPQLRQLQINQAGVPGIGGVAQITPIVNGLKEIKNALSNMQVINIGVAGLS